MHWLWPKVVACDNVTVTSCDGAGYGCTLPYHFNRFVCHRSQSISGDPAIHFLLISRDFGDLSGSQNQHSGVERGDYISCIYITQLKNQRLWQGNSLLYHQRNSIFNCAIYTICRLPFPLQGAGSRSLETCRINKRSRENESIEKQPTFSSSKKEIFFDLRSLIGYGAGRFCLQYTTSPTTSTAYFWGENRFIPTSYGFFRQNKQRLNLRELRITNLKVTSKLKDGVILSHLVTLLLAMKFGTWQGVSRPSTQHRFTFESCFASLLFVRRLAVSS